LPYLFGFSTEFKRKEVADGAGEVPEAVVEAVVEAVAEAVAEVAAEVTEDVLKKVDSSTR
jgi:hypothetical protein